MKKIKAIFEPTSFDFNANEYAIAELIGKTVEVIPNWDTSPIIGGRYNGQKRFMIVGHFYLSWFPEEDFQFQELTDEEDTHMELQIKEILGLHIHARN